MIDKFRRGAPPRLQRLAASAAAAATAFASVAAAQTAPPTAPQPTRPSPGAIGSGLIRNGQTFEQQQAPAGSPAPITGDTTAAGAATSTPTVSFVLKEVRFGASRFITRAQMQRLSTPLIGKTVTYDDLRKLVAGLNVIYARRGLATARAFLPPQKVSGGVLRIDFVEGRLGKLDVQPGRYTRAGYARRALKLQADQVIDLPQLRRDVQIFNRTNDAQLRLQLLPGDAPGQTDVTATVVDPARTALQVFVDNEGYNSTGRNEVGVFLRRSRVLFDGDRFTGYGVYSDGGLTGALTYGVATDASGGRATASASHSDIHVVNGETQDLDIDGTSDTYSLNYAKPVLGGDTWGVTASATGSYIRSEDDVTGVTTGTSIVKKAAGGLTAFAPVSRFGRISGDLLLSYAEVSQRVGIGASQFYEANADFEFVSVPVFGATFRLAGVGQYDDRKAIPGSQLFQAGGVNSVRGYEPGVLSGYAGYALQSEAHYDVSPFRKHPVDGFVFFDGGETYLVTAQHRTVRGVGFGLNIPVDRFTAQVTYGHALDRLTDSQASDRVDARLIASF